MQLSDTTSGRLSSEEINHMIYHHKICIDHAYVFTVAPHKPLEMSTLTKFIQICNHATVL